MATVADSFRELVKSLQVRSLEVEVLVSAGELLANEIDNAAGKDKSASAPVTSLRALMVDLVAKGSATGAHEPAKKDDWSSPTETEAAGAGAAKVRDEKKSGKGDARSRGRKGGASTS